MSKIIDSITLEILWNRLIGIANEAAVTLMRTSFSSIIRDSRDFSIAIFDDQMRYIAQAEGCTPGQLGCMLPIVKNFCSKFPPETLEPGDELIMNDPWLASSHLDDISICKPIFYDNKIVAYSVCTAHQIDIGGRGAGQEHNDVFEEGLWIPISKLCKAGVENEDVLNFIAHNVRVPEKVIGDVRAQMAVNYLIATRISELLNEYQMTSLTDLSDQILLRTEKSMRDKIREIPDGNYSYIHYGNRFKDGEDPLRICVEVQIKGDKIVVDFEGTSRQTYRAINCCQNMTLSYTLYGLKTVINPHIPNNAGTMAPISLKIPEANLLNPKFPAPVWGRTSVAHLLPEAIYSALAPVLKDKIIAQSNSSPLGSHMMRGVKRGGERFLIYHFILGGMGASATKDGSHCLSFPTTVGNTAIEILEADAPILFQCKELMCDSGGPGKFRGGCGQKISFVVDETGIEPNEQIITMIKGGKTDFPPLGVLGGKPAPTVKLKINQKEFRNERQHVLKGGDLFDYELPGGGGYGNPLERDFRFVYADVKNGLVSINSAKDDYGVVIEKDNLMVKEDETRNLRNNLLNQPDDSSL
jgi:N-methylhydantoinase B